jgi:nucleoside-diphosphate-sugar epimerase
VNVTGTVGLLRMLREQARETGRSVRFLFPSSIAVYGLPDRATKNRVGPVDEDEWAHPTALYGINKLQCEMLGTYFTARAEREGTPGIDFRSLRFPGLLSAETLPSGGTTDYAPEMIHAAAQGKPYACFVSPTRASRS